MKEISTHEASFVSGGMDKVEFCQGATTIMFGFGGFAVGAAGTFGFGAGAGFAGGLGVGAAVGQMACSSFFKND